MKNGGVYDSRNLGVYTFSWNGPTRYVDPNGEAVCGGLCIAAAVWAVVEVAGAIYDAYDTYKTVTDKNATKTEKAAAIGLFAAGVFLPGAGYSKVDDVAKWGIKGTKQIQRIRKKSQQAVNMLFGKNNVKNISLGGVVSGKEANAIAESIVGELKDSGKGFLKGSKKFSNKKGEEFMISYRGPSAKNSKFAKTGKQANLELFKKNADGKFEKIKNVHLNVDK